METDALARSDDGHEDEGAPSATVTVAVMSVPHITSGASVVMVPSCAWPVRVARALRGLDGRARASTGAPAPSRCGSLRTAASPRLSGTPRHETARLRALGELGHQDVVRGGADRPAATTRRRGRCRLPPRIHALPHAADPLHAIRPTGGDRLGATHRVDLRRAKGPPASSWSTFAYSNSVSISSSLGLQPTVVVVPGIRRAALQPRLARGQKPVAPVRGPRRRDPQFPRHRLEILPAQQTQHRLALAPSRKPTPTAAPGGRRFLNLDTPPASLAIKCPRKP